MYDYYRRPGVAERMRDRVREANRKDTRSWSDRNHDPAKVRARNAARVLTRQPCEECGAFPADAHHDDYARPLDVRWLCETHHGIEHRTIGVS